MVADDIAHEEHFFPVLGQERAVPQVDIRRFERRFGFLLHHRAVLRVRIFVGNRAGRDRQHQGQ
jgi:hypothetical protein